MKKQDYLDAIKIPFILFIARMVLSYILMWMLYGSYSPIGEPPGLGFLFVITILGYSLLLMLMHYLILFYSGWITVRKYKGNIKNAIYVGLIVGGIAIVLSYINMGLGLLTIPGYRALVFGASGQARAISSFTMIFSATFSIPFTLGIDLGISVLGGFIAEKLKKK